MRAYTALAVLVTAGLLAGCGGRDTLNCEDTARYSAATSAPPVRIPDDLSPPAETDALRLPPSVGATNSPTEPCLESPPNFYGDGGPRRLRRRDPEPAAEPAAAPEPPAESADPDRAIDN
jgi:hypothetical protein